MSELIVVAFDDPNKADEVLNELRALQREYLIDLEDAVVAVRRPDGKVQLKQSVNLVGMSAASGGLFGAFWGTRVGLLFHTEAQQFGHLRTRSQNADREGSERSVAVPGSSAAHLVITGGGSAPAGGTVGHCGPSSSREYRGRTRSDPSHARVRAAHERNWHS
jgi:hypothetical protein